MPNTVLSKHDVPAASPGWWEQFSAMVNARPKSVEDRLFDVYIKDRNLLPTHPDRTTVIRKLAHDGAQGLARPIITILLLTLAALLNPGTARAEQPDGAIFSVSGPHYCVDRDTLAGLVNAESGAQPYRVQVAVAQVFVKYAESKHSTVCWLARFTGFSTVPAYARRFPESYQARRFLYPPEELYTLADQVLRHELPDETGGATNFDGSLDGMSIVFSH